MTIKASGRSALVLLSGLVVCLAGPSRALTGAENAAQGSKSERASTLHQNARHGSHRQKSYALRKSGQIAPKSAVASEASAADDTDRSSVIPPWVANAYAEVASADTPAGSARAMSVRANDILASLANVEPATDAQVVASDQLNEVDRALQETPPAVTALASTETAVAPAPPAIATSNMNSAWDETSLIGKIFIGFGALLTIASAARMFMA